MISDVTNQRFICFPKDTITLENKVDQKQKTVYVSFFCHSTILNSISVRQPWDMEPGNPGWSSCSVTHWPCEDETDKAQGTSSLQLVFLAAQQE